MQPGDAAPASATSTSSSSDRREFLRRVSTVGALAAVGWTAPTVRRAGRALAAQHSPAPEPPPEPTCDRCSASAYGLRVVATGAAAVDATFPEPGGGDDCVGSVEVPIGTSGSVLATTVCGSAEGCQGEASVSELVVVFSNTVISASLLSSSADAATGCGSMASSVASLTVNGTVQPIGTSPNTAIDLPDGGSIVVNEQITGCSDDEPHDVTIAVNALRISLSAPGQALEVIAAHGDGRTCCSC